MRNKSYGFERSPLFKYRYHSLQIIIRDISKLFGI
jgi:hypothetical protein